MLADMHVHTTYSDGQYTPAEIIALAKAAGVKVISKTDHDTVGGTDEAAAAAEETGIHFISGVEISCKGSPDVHILGYGIDHNEPNLVKACSAFVEYRNIRNQQIIDYLRSKRVQITPDDVYAVETNANVVGRPHFARIMLNKGYVTTIQEAFAKYLATPEYMKAVHRKKPEAGKGIQYITQAGGLPCLAHPGYIKLPDAEIDALVGELAHNGLRCIECWYSTHTGEQTQFFLRLAKKYNIIPTGGTDFHGPVYKPDINLGTVSFYMTVEQVGLFQK